MLANVVNIQQTVEQLMTLIRDAYRLIDKGGSVLLNYPRSPRRLPFISFRGLKDLIYWEWLDRRVAILEDHEHELVLRLHN